MSNLPKDPYILLSVVNTKLRDAYGSLEAMCEDLDEDMQQIIDAMAKVGYHYDGERNAFIR